MKNIHKVLAGAGLTALGAIGTKAAVDYLRNRDQEEVVDESQGDQEISAPEEEVAYAVVKPESVQDFLDKSFEANRYVPNRSPKVFEYKGKSYMVIWARDNKQNKNQMLVFEYTDEGRDMIASVGYTTSKTDYNLQLSDTPFAVEVNGQKLESGKGETQGADNVDFVLS
ncbi:hypothetical protein [Crocosphaera chwakensis]|uniref:Uncharacterized protein n=1 Tax=Crocosphaera chwakensis CCY0110 TaxID=391612 RepID=A3IGZ2_9CHRO|nr:hypothetical protein [Crocosphaera chwakensis]EAZ94234.1 hypothetical protein CY0110_10177 [Crocosphaera chwakensis CCY0110]